MSPSVVRDLEQAGQAAQLAVVQTVRFIWRYLAARASMTRSRRRNMMFLASMVAARCPRAR
eukprot:6833776-Pyramimonas_sp.AAC.1